MAHLSVHNQTPPFEDESKPQKERWPSLFRVRVLHFSEAGKPRWKLKLDDSSFQADHCGVRSIVGTEFRKDALHSTFDGFLGD